MKIGMITDSLPGTDFDTLLATAARLELDMLEFGCGNWSSAPHLESRPHARERRRATQLQGAARRRTASAISALNCSGNPLHPGEAGRRHDDVTRKTIKLASLMGVDRVVMMSGCPGAPGDSHANWVTTEWPLEVREILRWQWDEVLIPYWRDLVAYANGLGIRKLCLELHGHQNVYNVRTMLRLRDAVGETVGANFDPSHPMWMGADPLAAARALGDAIYHVHAKDTRVDPVIAGVNGVIETMPGDRFRSARGTTSRWATATASSGGANSSPCWRRSATTTCSASSTRTRCCRRSKASRSRSPSCATCSSTCRASALAR